MPNPYKEGKEDGAKGRPRRTYNSEVDQVAYNSAYNFKLKERQARLEAEKAEAQALEDESDAS